MTQKKALGLTVIFGLLSLPAFFDFFNTPFFIIVQGLVGMLNAFLWPSMIGIIGMWFPKKSRGFIAGLWATCNNTGNIVGIQVGSWLLQLLG